MANPNDFSGTPQHNHPDDTGAGEVDPFESAPPPPAAQPLRPAERISQVAPRQARISPNAFSGSTNFESAPRPAPAAPEPAPAPGSRHGNPTGHRAGTPRDGEEDVFETEESLPSVAPRNVAPAPAIAVTEENEDESESGTAPGRRSAPASTAAAEAEGAEASGPRRISKPEKLGLAAVLVALLAILGAFASALHASRPSSSDSDATESPKTPMKGEVATLSKIETDWRPRKDSDRVSMMETMLPEVSTSQPGVLPEVTFSIDPSASKTGFLRFIFLNPEGEISGDVLTVKVNQGKLESMGNGAEVTSGTDGKIYCSVGFLDKPGYVAYAIGDFPRWTVEVSESTDYNAREDGWKRLGHFEVHERQP